MSAPYLDSLSTTSFIVIAIVLGFFFGFFLERAGFSSARKLTRQFYFKDFAVLKVMFTAIVIAMLGIVYLSLLGWLNVEQLYIPGTFLWPQLVGGLLLGAGFIVGGYCPGTSVAAAAIGKIDGLLFIAGIMLGIFAFDGTEEATAGERICGPHLPRTRSIQNLVDCPRTHKRMHRVQIVNARNQKIA